MPRKSIGETAMTRRRTTGPLSCGARRRQTGRPRAARARSSRPGPALDRSCRRLVEAQVEYAAWLDNLPDSLQDSATAEALRAICDLDLTELQAIQPPRGFGRD